VWVRIINQQFARIPAPAQAPGGTGAFPLQWPPEPAMPFASRCLALLILLAPLPAPSQETQVSRIWIADQEAGTSVDKKFTDAAGLHLENRESSHLERMGVVIQLDLRQEAVKRPDGTMRFTWSLSMSQEPQEGQGAWSPKAPGQLKLTFKDGPPRTLDIPAGALVWPGDLEDRLRAAARTTQPVRLKHFAFPTQQWAEVDLKPLGPEPLPGFPDTVHFRGRSAEGSMVEDVDLWISPSQGEVKHLGSMAGVPVLSQRVELPAPAGLQARTGLFERTIKALPPNPFLLWLPELTVRWSGRSVPDLAEDPQQRRLAPNRYQLLRAQPPTALEAAQRPVTGRPSAQDAPYLAATPLVQYHDPVFAGLERRLNPPPDATRWQLAQLVTSFVFDWIKDKNYTVGFASAQEVARNPVGACAQHGVLAVALLRRLGVPARGVTGWIALGETLAMHFWVEAEVGGRWIPLDPTFDQAPASAYRLKLLTTDLADMGNVGAGTPGTDYLGGIWLPEGPWAGAVRVQGDTVTTPGGLSLRVPGARWKLDGGRLALIWGEPHRVEAVPAPAPAQRTDARRMQGAAKGRQGWWQPRTGQCWIDLGAGQWLQVDALTEPQAFRLLDALEPTTRAQTASKAA
jgi:transglutaminase-like putative cysteine protease